MSGPASSPLFASPDDLPPPSGYSHVVSIPPGRLVWTSGQVGIGTDGAVAEGWEGQTRTAGADWPDVVKLTLFVVDVAELQTIRAVRDEFVDTGSPPTSSLVQVAGLFRPDVLIEIEAVAYLPLATPEE